MEIQMNAAEDAKKAADERAVYLAEQVDKRIESLNKMNQEAEKGLQDLKAANE